MKSQELRVAVLMNSYTEGVSGGDIAMVEMLKRSSFASLEVVTSQKGKIFCQEHGLQADFVLTTLEDTLPGPTQLYIMRIFFGLWKSIRLRKMDLIYVSSDFLPCVLPAVFMKIYWFLRGHRVCLFQKSFHMIPRERKISYWSQRMSLFLMKIFADCVGTCSETSSQKLRDAGMEPRKLFVNYLGTQRSAVSDHSHRAWDGVFLARLHSSKGISELPKIWKNVVLKKPDAKLCVAGHGSQEVIEQFQKEIQSLGLESSVQYRGSLEKEQVEDYLSSGRLFVFPSHEEGFGIGMVEAMAAGTLPIAYQLPVFEEVMSRGASLVPMFDIEKFSSAIIEALEQGVSKQKKEAMASLVQKCSWDACALRESNQMALVASLGH